MSLRKSVQISAGERCPVFSRRRHHPSRWVGFGEGRAPACWYLTKPGLAEIADAKGIGTSDLSWVPDHSYRSNKLLAHRLGVNAFFCALAEASRSLQDHCLAT
jgi:hypothetical protein